jgi:hypothetical protein
VYVLITTVRTHFAPMQVWRTYTYTIVCVCVCVRVCVFSYVCDGMYTPSVRAAHAHSRESHTRLVVAAVPGCYAVLRCAVLC